MWWTWHRNGQRSFFNDWIHCSDSLVLVGQSQTELLDFLRLYFFFVRFYFLESVWFNPCWLRRCTGDWSGKGCRFPFPQLFCWYKAAYKRPFLYVWYIDCVDADPPPFVRYFFLSLFSNEWSTERLTSCGRIRGQKKNQITWCLYSGGNSKGPRHAQLHRLILSGSIHFPEEQVGLDMEQ